MPEPSVRRMPARGGRIACAVSGMVAPLVLSVAWGQSTVPPAALPPTAEVASICAQATSALHCGRLVEALQLQRFPELARRSGDHLVLELRGHPKSFDDSAERAYAFWGYLAPIDAVVVYSLVGDAMHMLLVMQQSGAAFELASEPLLSPDAARVATVDFCDEGCDNEIVIWRVEGATLRKERYYRPRTRWLDVSARWKNADTVLVERRTEAVPNPTSFEFRLGDPGWFRIDGR